MKRILRILSVTILVMAMLLNMVSVDATIVQSTDEPPNSTITATPTDEPAPLALSMAADTGTWTEYGPSGHASANENSVSFTGHPKNPFTSMLYRAANDGDYRILTFHLTEGTADWHTLEGSGFLFNAGISGGLLNGYAVLFTQSDVGYYKLSNVSMSALASQTFTHVSGVQLLEKKPKPAYSQGQSWYLKLVMSPGSLRFEQYPDAAYAGTPSVIFNTTINDPSSGAGYGPFASFLSHDCSSISTSTLEYFSLTIKPNTPPTVSAPDVTLNRGDSFVPMGGVKATDLEDGTLTEQVTIESNNVNTQIPGVYQVVYSVADVVGASTSCTRNVTVLADVVFIVKEKGTETPIADVGITLGNLGEIITAANGETPPCVLVPGAYRWEITKQNDDYLPLLGKRSVQIDSSATNVWPMRIPVELTKKYNDIGVDLVLSKVEDKALLPDVTAKYDENVAFTLLLTNHGNQITVPTISIKVPDGLTLTDTTKSKLKPTNDQDIFEYTSVNPLDPQASESIELSFKITTLAASITLTPQVSVAKLTLPDTNTIVSDVNSENNASSAQLKVKNMPVVLSKLDSASKKPLEGVQLSILLSDSTLKAAKQENGTWVVDANGVENLPTDKDGKITIYGIEPGNYTVKETKPLQGYALPTKPWSFSIAEDGTTTGDTQLFNEPTSLEITKLDSVSKAPLEGADFKIIEKDSKDGKSIKATKQTDGSFHIELNGNETLITDKDGRIVIRYLPVGDYTLLEIKAPEGYSLSQPIYATVTDAHSISTPLKTTVLDKPLALKIMKVTKENKPLSGAGFTIKKQGDLKKALVFSKDDKGIYRLDPNGKDTTVMVDSKGIALVYGLPLGEYQLEETIIPAGYFPSVPQKIIIKDEHNIDKPYEATVVNEVQVKLGFDSDGWRIPIAIGLVLLALCGCAVLVIKLRSHNTSD